MRIVQLANFYGPRSGGLRVAVDTFRAGYREAGHDALLVVPGPADESGGDVWTLRSPALPDGSGYRVIVRRRALLAALDRLRPDLLEVHDKLLQHWVWRWSRTRRVPVVGWSHERLASSLPMLAPFAPDPVTRRAAAGIARHTLHRCDALVVGSRFAAAEFPGPVRVVPLGVDLDTFRPHAAPPPGGPVRLVLVSRLSAEKRADLAVGALRVLHARGVDVTLTVVGGGPLQDALRRDADGLPVRFAGYLDSRAAVAGELANADVALAPGPAETFGLAALESLACGTAVVATAGAAPAEVLAGRPMAGRTAAADPAAFADAIEALLRVPVAERHGAARRRAEEYPWPAAVRRMLDVHAEVTDRTVLAHRPAY